MTSRYPARVKQKTATTGTGTIVLSGTYSGFRTFFEHLGASGVCVYCIQGTGIFEVGVGTFTNSGSTLTRLSPPLFSSNAGALVDLPSGDKDVFLTDIGAPSLVTSFTGATTVLAEDHGTHFIFTGTANTTLAITALANMSDWFGIRVTNAGSATLTVDPNASESILANALASATTATLYPGETGLVHKSSSSLWRLITWATTALAQPQAFGAGQGTSTVQGAALQAWLNYHSATPVARVEKPGSFLCDRGLTARIGEIDWGGSSITFDAAISHSTDLISLLPMVDTPSENMFVRMKNLRMFCQFGGRDAIRFRHGFPTAENIYIDEPYQDAIALYTDGATSYYIEKYVIRGVRGFEVGRHFVHATINPNGTPSACFVNEGIITECETRGLGRKFADSNALCVTFTSGVTLANEKFSNLVMFNNLFDGIKTGSLANDGLGAGVHFRENGGSNEGVESVNIFNTTFESTAGVYSPLKDIVKYDSAINLANINTDLILRSQWCDGYAANLRDKRTARLWNPDQVPQSFTPTIFGSTTAGAHTYSGSTNGLYWVNGPVVVAIFAVILTAKDGAMAGDARVGGLPFNVDTTTSCGVGQYSNLTHTGTSLALTPLVGTKTAAIHTSASGVGSAAVPSSGIAATTALWATLTYMRAAS